MVVHVSTSSLFVVGEAGSASEPALVDKKGSSRTVAVLHAVSFDGSLLLNHVSFKSFFV